MTKPKKLSLVSLVAIAAGQVIGAGVVTLIGPAIAVTGMSAWLAYGAAVVVGLMSVLPFIFLSSAVVLEGGEYSIVIEMLGKKAAGIYAVAYISQTLGLSLMGTSIGFYFESLFPNINGQIAAVTAVTIFFVFNLLGVNVMARLQTILTIILLTTLASFIIIGIPQVDPIVFDFSHADFLTDGSGGFMAAIALFVYSTYGQYFVISFSGKAKNPKRNIPLAIIIATAIIFVVYVGIGIVGSGTLPINEAAGKPLTVVAEAILPGILFPIFIVGGPLLALSSTLNSTYSARAIPILKSVGDGWFPKWVGKTNRKGVPYVIMLFIYIIGVIPIISGVSIREITSNIVLLTYLLRMITAIAIIRLPRLYPEQWKQSFLHVSNKVFYLFMGLTFMTQLYMVYLSILNLTTIMIVINTTFVILCIIWAMWRVRSNKVNIQQNISFE